MLEETTRLSVEPAQIAEVSIFFPDCDCDTLIDYCVELLFN